MSPDLLPARIAAKIEVDANDCWLFTGARRLKRGERTYGMARWGPAVNGRYRTAYVHRITWHLLVDPTFPVYGGWWGEQLDHVVCGVKQCCNPAHVEPCSTQTNTARYWQKIAA